MSAKKIIIIDHDEEGCQIEALGFTGNACEAATKTIEEALGATITDRKHKPEFHQTTTAARAVQTA